MDVSGPSLESSMAHVLGVQMQAIRLMQKAGFFLYGVLHVGANDGQERFEYQEAGANPCIYVEPIEFAYQSLLANISELPGHVAIQAVCSDVSGEAIKFNIADNGGLSSSMLPLGAHADFHPEIRYASSQSMITTTVDDLLGSMTLPVVPNLLVVDTQGADLKVLRGAKGSLPYFDAALIEVSDRPLYEGGATQAEITDFLTQNGFRLTWIDLDQNGHGDAFYSRTSGEKLLQLPPTPGPNIALGRVCTQSSASGLSNADDANAAVRGNLTGTFSFHTAKQQNPWWQVDLGSIQAIREIRVFNRLDACRERARTMQVLISDDGARWRLAHDHGGYAFGGIDGRPVIVNVGEEARFVKLKLNEYTYLHLDAVEVY